MTTPLRLFADAHVFDQEYQGSRTFIKELYSRLALKPGLKIFLGAYDIENLAKEFGSVPNINYIKYKRRSSIRRLLFNLPAILQEWGIDWAHFQYMVPPVKKCRYIVTTHDVIFEDYPEEFTRSYRLTKKLLYRHGARLADILTTVSSFSQRSIEKHLGIEKGKTLIIPNGVSEKFYATFDKQKSKTQIALKYGIDRSILYVSRFEPRKNHAALLKAWTDLELYKQGIWLVLLGHRSLRVENFDRMMQELPENIRSYIYINDSVDDDDLLDFYRAADLFVYPSKAEGFGISPLEAAALKVPVICSNTSAMSEFTFFNKGHINTSDPELLKKTIAQMLLDPPSMQELTNISEKIIHDFSWDDAADKFYHQLLQQKIVTSIPKLVHNDQLPVS